MTLRVAMVGLGVISRYYAAALASSSEMTLLAVHDTLPERCEPYRRAGIATVADLAEILDRDDLDAVLVNVPNNVHREVCCAALEHDLHVCCEKPLATTPRDAEAMVELAHRHERVLFTALHRRYNSNFTRIRAAALGHTVDVTARYLEDIRAHCGDELWYLDPLRCGGGCLADNGPNAFDLVLELLGPVRITDCELRTDANGVDLQARVAMLAGDGSKASVELDWAFPTGEAKDLAITFADRSSARCDLLEAYDELKSSLYHEYAGVLADFARAVRLGSERGKRGLELVRLVDDAYRLASVEALRG